MSVVFLITTNISAVFSESSRSKFRPHPASGIYAAIACSSSGNAESLQLSGNAKTVARTFTNPMEIFGGNVRSDAGIMISGNAIVNGDATPAPGYIVDLKGNGAVIGSVEPAEELLECSIGDLSQLISWVMENNDNASIPPSVMSMVGKKIFAERLERYFGG